MTKFKCVKSTSSSEHTPKVGDVIEGELVGTRIVISNVGNRMAVNGRPYWNIGEKVPLKGSVWTWEEIK
ncbi:hypothetical protein HWD01_gp15 [Escherichia phage flopper]|uniref:Uncharacterized protein n=1 Tax=Escherichia phage flopper TaxID=2696397 RepID=A0A6B9WST2_9CAUD|nr:hypothetical protein HWD01_gp15 [Escherichia phage flopper]QHR68757.1 hypothetical protein flopper_15 [Escherichia phage flopper]